MENKKWSELDIMLYNDSAKVYIKESYFLRFKKSRFYPLWIESYGDLVLVINLEDYETDWNLEEFYFLPYLKEFNGRMFYDLLREEEKLYFRGLGSSVFKMLIEHIFDTNEDIASEMVITMGATNVLKSQGDLLKLVKFYEGLSFKIDYDEYNNFMRKNQINRYVTSKTVDYEIENVGKPGFLEYVPMKTTFKDVLLLTE